MADQQDPDRPSSAIGDVVGQVTLKALQEFDTGDMESKKSSRPASAKSGTGSRPVSAQRRSTAGSPQSPKPGSRVGGGSPLEVTGSRPASGAGSKASSRPVSAASRRSPADQPVSATGSKAGSRPTSAARPPSGIKERPPSGTPSSRRSSGQMDLPTKPSSAPSAMKAGSRPTSSKKLTPSPAPSIDEEPIETGRTDGPERTLTPQNQEDGLPPQQTADYDFGEYEDFQVSQPQDEPAPGQTVLDSSGQPPMDPDGGDGSDGESDGDEEEQDLMEEDSDSDDGENEMVVLDPDHPLMRRFQNALKTHLVKQNEKVTLELRELSEAMKNRKGEREDLGVELYGVQQELARHQMLVEKYHDQYAEIQQQRLQTEQQLDDIREMYKDKKGTVNTEKRKGTDLQTEVENLALRLFYMGTAKTDVRSDIAVMRRAAEKAESEVFKAEEEKQKQDLYVDRLVERVDKLREEISMYDAQQSAQGDETKAAKDALLDAHMEIESIELEKKQLYQQWNSSLIGMRRRDEAHSAMIEALHQQQQKILSMETEVEGYKRSITKEQEQNEKLTMIFSKTDIDINQVRRQLAQCQAKHETLKNEYAMKTRMLHETELGLNRINGEKTLKQNELNALRKLIEREFLEKVKLEDDILEKLRAQLTMDKAAQYTYKLTGNLRIRTKDLDTQVATVENEISKTALDVSHTRTRCERLEKIMQQLDDEIHGKNEIISKSEAEMTKRNAIIERKQGVIDQYNKRLEQMIISAGGVELGPLEIQINSLQKSIDAELQEIVELQQMWLRDQSELVRLSREKEDEGKDVEKLKKQLTILSQKKLRIENEIDLQHNETADIERNIGNMHNDMLKLNMLLHKERGTQYNLQQGNILMENDFIGSLKEAEKQSITMQQQLDGMKEEKERLLNSLVEAERQIMLWEKKTQLARETRQAVDSEVGQGEIRAMKAEIHRMQVRYTQLMKQQERMIQEMEKAVSRRDTIVTRGDAQAKMNKKVMTKGTFHRQLTDLRKKIKQTIQDAQGSDQDIQELRGHQQQLSHVLEEKQLNVSQLQNSTDTLDGDVDRLYEHKQKNMVELLARQQKAKYYQQVKDGKYTRLCKTNTALETERNKQVERAQTLQAIVDRLIQEFPHAQPSLRKVAMTLATRVGTDGSQD